MEEAGLLPHLDGTERGLVVMMCGLPGSGKSTYAQALERRGYIRLSIDEVVWARTGRDGADLDPAGRREQRHRLRRTAGTLLRRLRGARRRG
ncbi:AAA family ATPase [Kitasatospora cineracea]|uniref:AAA family ATPase n=1 Tax=Kitasatospora cineracea TaxID=88074 RepID=UPI00380CE88F